MESLLYIPDISGFTEFVHQTEIEHSRHIVSELLELNQRLEERIELLEQPRGIRGLVAKFRGRGKKAANPDQMGDVEGTLEAPESDG